jgi:hypothetical protein
VMDGKIFLNVLFSYIKRSYYHQFLSKWKTFLIQRDEQHLSRNKLYKHLSKTIQTEEKKSITRTSSGLIPEEESIRCLWIRDGISTDYRSNFFNSVEHSFFISVNCVKNWLVLEVNLLARRFDLLILRTVSLSRYFPDR